MRHSKAPVKKRDRRDGLKSGTKHQSKVASRYTVALAPSLVHQVEQYAGAADTSMSRAIAALVRLGLENQEKRKREFFQRLKQNLASDDPKQEDRLVDEFRALILGR
jgi:hypothetical protein